MLFAMHAFTIHSRSWFLLYRFFLIMRRYKMMMTVMLQVVKMKLLLLKKLLLLVESLYIRTLFEDLQYGFSRGRQLLLYLISSNFLANHKGTVRSKKKKQAKLQRAVRSMKRQQRLSSKDTGSNYYSPLNHLKDPQGFSEKLFSKLQSCNERFEVKMMILKVIARTIGLHRLMLISFYSYLQKYVQPHQRDITNLLAAAVQFRHAMMIYLQMLLSHYLNR